MKTFRKSLKWITDKLSSQTVRVPIRKRISNAAALVCVLMFLTVPYAHAHSAKPVGSINVVLNQQFSVSMFETPGFSCNAFCSLSIDNPTILGIVSSETAWVGIPPQYFTLKANPNYIGTATLTYSFVGEDRYYNNNEGPCQGQGSYSLVINVVEPPEEESSGNTAFSGTDGDPVNTFNGELFFSEPYDLNLGGPMPLYFQRYFASYLRRAFIVGELGDNWRHNFEWSVHWTGNNLTLIDDVGRIIRYTSDGAGNWTQQSGLDLPYQILQDEKEINLFNPKTGLYYNFSPWGKLAKIEDGKGNTLTLTYESWSHGKLEKVSDGLGRELRFSYTTVGSLVKLTSVHEVQDGSYKRSVSFSYDANGDRLEQFIDANNKYTVYTYLAPDGADRVNLQIKQLPRGNSHYTQTYYTTADGVNSGKVKTQTDTYGNVQTFTYSGITTTMADPNSIARMHIHDSGGALVSSTDKDGKTFTLGSDSTGRRNSVTDKLDDTTSYAYDSTSARLSNIGHADGTTTSYTYASRTVNGFTQRDLTRVDYPDGTSEIFSYDATGNLLSRTDRMGKTTAHTYNSRGQVLSTTTPLGGKTQYIYNADGTLSSITDNSGNTTNFIYDLLRRITGVVHADSSTQSYTYNNMDQLLTVTDGRANTTTFTYDDNGNMVTMTDRANNTTTFTYDQMDRPVSIQDPLGNTATRTYDKIGRPATFTDTGGNTITMGYDALDRMTSLTDASGNIWSRSFDGESIISSATDPLLNGTSYASDSMGRITSATTPQGGTSSFTYDSIGRVTGVTDPLGNTTSKTYDSGGLVSSVTLPGGAITTSYSRNAIGQITSVTDSLGNNWQRQYDAQGRMTSITDPLGNQTSIAYDTRNRPSTITYPGAAGTLTMTYDANSNLTQRSYSADSLTLNYTYDAMDRLASANGMSYTYTASGAMANSNGVAATYDADGRPITLTLVSGKLVTYEYDADGRLTTVTDWVGGNTTFAYDTAGRVLTTTKPNGITTTYTYNSDGQVTNITEGAISSITLTRNAKGQVTSSTVNLPTPPRVVASETRSYSFNAAHQESSASTYDVLGRLTGDGTCTYVWDGGSRLDSYIENGNTVTFTYDANGRRISRTGNGVTSGYTWNDILPNPSISVVQENASDLRYYIHTPAGALLYSVEASDDSRRYYHFDQVGNVVFLTDDTGVVIGSYAYSPYGDVLASTGGLDNPFTWQGNSGIMQEGTSGLYYNRARYYDSMTGRFISREPMVASGPRGINPYQYAWGNPMRYTDPNGLYTVSASSILNYSEIESNTMLQIALQTSFDNPTNSRQTVILKPPTGNGPRIVSDGGGDDTLIGNTPNSCDCINPDWTSISVSLVSGGLEEGFKRQGRAVIQRGLQGGSFSGAATAGRRAAGAKLGGSILGGGLAAWDEYGRATAQGQSGTSVAGRTVWAGATGTLFNYAAAPVALVDSATGGNGQAILNQGGNVAATLMEGERAFSGYRKSMESAPPAVRGLHHVGEDWAEEGFLGMFGKLYDCYAN